jgi:cell division protein FtsB
MMGVVLGIFFIHHLWLVNQNLTTNERMKREELLAHLESRKTRLPEKKDEVEAEIKKLAGNPYNKGFYANLREIVLAY